MRARGNILAGHQRALSILLAATMAACSSDDGGTSADASTPDATSADTSGGDDAAVDTAPATPDSGADVGVADGTQGDAPACDPAMVGEPCDPTKDDCEAGHQCLEVSPQQGYCSCACMPDQAGTKVQDEDSCPMADPALTCGPVGSGGGADLCQSMLTSGNQHPACVKIAIIVSDPGDQPYMLAGRLTPQQYPFWVTGVRYLLAPTGGNTATCDTGAEHAVQIVVTDGAAPPAEPQPVETINVAATQGTTEVRWVRLALDTPVQLQQGQSLLVLIEVALSGGKGPCLYACADEAGAGSDSFATIDQNQPPFDWKSFEQLSWPGELMLGAFGFAGAGQ